MALTESAFLLLADATLNRLMDMAEVADEEGVLDVELADGILTVTLPNGRQFLINRHKPSLQLWYSSPLSGGLHFEYDETEKTWTLDGGRRLDTLLKAELEIMLTDD